MHIIHWLELLLISTVLVLGFTQLVLPLWRGRPTWPMFGRRAKAEEAVGEALETKDVIILEQFARNIKRGARK